MAALASVEYRCSDLHWCYLQQTVHFFQSDTKTVIPNELAFTNLDCSISSYTLKGLRSNKPSHKHDSCKYQSTAFAICDHKSDQTRSATHVNKTYLVWLMYWLLFTQYYQHCTNQKLKLVFFKRFISKLKNWPLYPNFIPFTPLLPHLFIYSVSFSKIRVVYI